MKNDIFLDLELPVYRALWGHLLPRKEDRSEQAAFLFLTSHESEVGLTFKCVHWLPVRQSSFTYQSAYHLELSDEMRARVIKMAHDLRCSLCEVHSHISFGAIQFSASDLAGLREFVPHVMWRLRNRPYVALVVSQKGCDGLVWIDNPKHPRHLTGVMVNQLLIHGSSQFTSLEEYNNRNSI